MRGPFGDRLPLRCRSVTRSHLDPNVDITPNLFAEQCPNFLKRLLEVLANIVAQCAEGRDIQDPGFSRQLGLTPFREQMVEGSHKRSQGFP